MNFNKDLLRENNKFLKKNFNFAFDLTPISFNSSKSRAICISKRSCNLKFVENRENRVPRPRSPPLPSQEWARRGEFASTVC